MASIGLTVIMTLALWIAVFIYLDVVVVVGHAHEHQVIVSARDCRRYELPRIAGPVESIEAVTIINIPNQPEIVASGMHFKQSGFIDAHHLPVIDRLRRHDDNPKVAGWPIDWNWGQLVALEKLQRDSEQVAGRLAVILNRDIHRH